MNIWGLKLCPFIERLVVSSSTLTELHLVTLHKHTINFFVKSAEERVKKISGYWYYFMHLPVHKHQSSHCKHQQLLTNLYRTIIMSES